jgi:uncharacterized protein YbbK (DUF523 family)
MSALDPRGTVKTAVDLTDRMDRYAQQCVERLARQRLCGDVLEKDSPSCGNEGVKADNAHRVPNRSGQGLFASALPATLPFLPIEEEGRLSDPRIRDNFAAPLLGQTYVEPHLRERVLRNHV